MNNAFLLMLFSILFLVYIESVNFADRGRHEPFIATSKLASFEVAFTARSFGSQATMQYYAVGMVALIFFQPYVTARVLQMIFDAFTIIDNFPC